MFERSKAWGGGRGSFATPLWKAKTMIIQKIFKNNAKMCCKFKKVWYNHFIEYKKSYEKAANRVHASAERSFTG